MKSKKTIFITIGIVSCAVLIIAALAGGMMALARPVTATQPEQSTVGQTEPEAILSAQPLENSTDDYIGEDEAKSIALAHVGLSETDVSHMFCKFDYDDGIAEYEVEFWDGTIEYDYEINAVNGEIMGYDYDMESYDAKPVTTPDTDTSADYIGEDKAKSIALAHAGVTESDASQIICKFDFDDGHAEYEVEWKIGRMEYEYTISATDGTIWEHDVEYDD